MTRAWNESAGRPFEEDASDYAPPRYQRRAVVRDALNLLAQIRLGNGVEGFGFDISDPIDADTRTELEALWFEHAILLFPSGTPPGPKRKIHRATIAGDRAMGRQLPS